MTTSWLARARVDDPEPHARYASQLPGILERYGCRVPARGGAHEVLEAPAEFTRFVLIALPSLDAARDWFGRTAARCRRLRPRRHPARRAGLASGAKPRGRQRLSRGPRRC